VLSGQLRLQKVQSHMHIARLRCGEGWLPISSLYGKVFEPGNILSFVFAMFLLCFPIHFLCFEDLNLGTNIHNDIFDSLSA
jgi:hypothetical protein